MIDKPKIRAVEAFPIEQNGETYVCLRDPGGIAPDPVVVGMGAYFLITLFDGTNSLIDIQTAFTRRFGEILPAEPLRQLVETLDRSYFLDSPTSARRVEELRREFDESPRRKAALAGLCYEKEPARLRAEIEGFFRAPGGPGQIPDLTAKGPALSGLISPHIDPRRGGPAYAHAYGELMKRERPELVIILGTSHYGVGPELFSATRKDYMTPFGAVRTDGEFTDRLAERYTAGDLFGDEVLHRNEHSIEFQALFLSWALGTEGYQVVPVLVSSFHEMVRTGAAPTNDSRVAGFIEAIQAELASENRRVLIVAGVDFAHVGRKFGDSFAADENIAQWVKNEDLALIENIKRGDPDGFFGDVAKDGDKRKICGLSPMYTQLMLLRGHRARLLMHDIAMEPLTESAVSFASLAID